MYAILIQMMTVCWMVPMHVHSKDLLRLAPGTRDEPVTLEMVRRMLVVPPELELLVDVVPPSLSRSAPAADDVVYDLGAGSGYFSFRLARVVTAGRVVAAAVMRAASDEGVGDSLEDSEIESRIDAAFWDPRYRRYVAA